MKNKTILLSTLLVAMFSITLISGCKKESKESCTDGVKNQNETGVDCGGSCGECPIPKIKTEIYDYGGFLDTATYFYDSQGRVASITHTNSGAPDTEIFTYTADSIVVTGGQPRFTYLLNSDGYASSLFVANGQSGFIYVDDAYTYDTEGHLISRVNLLNGLTRNFQWSEGNMISETLNGNHRYTYTHLADKVNTIGNQNKGKSFLGVDSKNMAGSGVDVSTGDTAYFSYEFDSQNRVTKYVNVNTTYTYY